MEMKEWRENMIKFYGTKDERMEAQRKKAERM